MSICGCLHKSFRYLPSDRARSTRVMLNVETNHIRTLVFDTRSEIRARYNIESWGRRITTHLVVHIGGESNPATRLRVGAPSITNDCATIREQMQEAYYLFFVLKPKTTPPLKMWSVPCVEGPAEDELRGVVDLFLVWQPPRYLRSRSCTWSVQQLDDPLQKHL
jgi:hypothetical protein